MRALVKSSIVTVIIFCMNYISHAELVAHWTMNDNAATTIVTDSSTNAYNGTANKNTDLLHADSGNYPYLNGAFKFDGTKAFSGPMNSQGAVQFGKDTHSYYYDGALDDVRIYKKALTAEEVSQLYDAAFPHGTIVMIK